MMTMRIRIGADHGGDHVDVDADGGDVYEDGGNYGTENDNNT